MSETTQNIALALNSSSGALMGASGVTVAPVIALAVGNALVGAVVQQAGRVEGDSPFNARQFTLSLGATLAGWLLARAIATEMEEARRVRR